MLRRFVIYVILTATFFAAVLILSTSTKSDVTKVVETVKQPETIYNKLSTIELPSFRPSFHKSAHKPPEQRNSTHGESSWYSDWKWLNPFSSSVTLDEERSVLPILLSRPPVYVFYDTTQTSKDAEAKIVENEMLLTWRRAWWSRGFRPVVLTEAEAMNNPLYQELSQKGMPAALEAEFLRFLAWGHMGTGLLANISCIPMGAYDDHLLTNLRRGDFPQLTRFEGLGSGLFAGSKQDINDAIQEAFEDVKLSAYKNIIDAIKSSRFKVEQATSLAHYDDPVIRNKYPALEKELAEDNLKGRRALIKLMTAHLHTIWQNTFSGGIAVLNPLPAHSTSLIKPSIDLAVLLAECPESILQSSCPPNRPKCSPCVGSRMTLTSPLSFRNQSDVFTISVVPHPFTMITLNNLTDKITSRHIRRNTDRDQWVTAVTRDILGSGRGGPSRVVGLKEAIASDYGSSRSLWFATEDFPASFNPPPPKAKSPTNDAHPEPVKIEPFPEEWIENLDWHFGFPIPRSAISHGESLPPVPGPERWTQPLPGNGPQENRKTSYDPNPPTEAELLKEVDLLQIARKTVKSKKGAVAKVRGAAEGWNLADTEIWKFARAYRGRSVVERLQFEEEESAYFGSGNARGKNRWWR